MPFTLIATQAVQGPYVTTPVSATSLDLTFTAADNVHGNYYIADTPITVRPEGVYGGDVILVWNTGGGAATFTLTSQPDAAMRTGDITAYSVGAGVISAFKISQITGWADVSNFVYFLASASTVKFAILQR